MTGASGAATDVTPPPVFIVGPPRAGTTLLYRLLLRHPAFFPPAFADEGSVVLAETKMFETATRTYDPDDVDAFHFMLENEEAYNDFLDLVPRWRGRRLFEFLDAVSRKVLRGPRLRATYWRLSGNSSLLEAYFARAHTVRGADRLLAKDPQLFRRLPELSATFPDAQALFLSRHPLDVFSSYAKRLHDSEVRGDDPARLSWLRISPEAFADEYNTGARVATETARAEPDRFLIVDYERLVQEPVAELTRTLTHVGESFDEACLPDPEAALDVYREGRSNRDVRPFGPILTESKNWRDHLDQHTANHLEDLTASGMLLLGHDQRT